jgi:hypothetical protein
MLMTVPYVVIDSATVSQRATTAGSSDVRPVSIRAMVASNGRRDIGWTSVRVVDSSRV